MEITFTVPGECVGKGRPRFSTRGGFVKTYTPEKTAYYENLVKLMYTEAAKGKRFEDGEPICISIRAYYAVPKSASKKKANEMLAGRIYPTKKPDTDNVLKLICDALNEIAYKDDAQIVCASVSKHYGETPGAIIHLRSLADGFAETN